MITDTLYILTVLCLIVVLSEVLVRKTVLQHFGTALLVIVVTAIIANIGILPAGSTEERPVVAYDGIFMYLAPISIFWLLLRVNLREILKVGLPMLILFIIAALGTTFGIVLGMWLVNGPKFIGNLFPAVGGMFVGTYTGGSVNFNAIALNYDVVRNGVLYGGSIVVDNIITTFWMIATLALPRVLAPLWKKVQTTQVENAAPLTGIEEDTESMHPIDLGMVLALGIGALFISNQVSAWLTSLGYTIPSILIITLLSLLLAQLPIVKQLRGAQTLGIFSVYLFLAVIGAFCDVQALGKLGSLGFVLLGMTLIGVLMHGLITFGAARLMKLDLDVAAVVSQANVGGGTSALALARSLGRQDLVLPAVLLGSLGNAIGTFLGFWAAEQLLPWMG